jgi:alkanesulfonate monooxygenase SsuD/methylene tetrahydromethanopterin reductase-like flavin-dependent oxidoreductase (luciferase family)
MLRDTLAYSVVGSRETVRQGLDAFVAGTDADELMVTAQVFDHQARLRSFEITAEAKDTKRPALLERSAGRLVSCC